MIYLNALFMFLFGAFVASIYDNNGTWIFILGAGLFILTLWMNHIDEE